MSPLQGLTVALISWFLLENTACIYKELKNLYLNFYPKFLQITDMQTRSLPEHNQSFCAATQTRAPVSSQCKIKVVELWNDKKSFNVSFLAQIIQAVANDFGPNEYLVWTCDLYWDTLTGF